MMKLVGRVIGLLLLVAAIGIGAVNLDTGGYTSETSTITDYRADFTVDADGTLSAVETLTVDFPVSRHGIFRFFDTRDPNFAKNRLIPYDIDVTRDGAPEPFDIQREGR